MVERFNRRIAEAIRTAPKAARNSGKNRFDTHAERDAFIHDFVNAYNRTRLRCLKYIAPSQALANHAENNTCAGAPRRGLCPRPASTCTGCELGPCFRKDDTEFGAPPDGRFVAGHRIQAEATL